MEFQTETVIRRSDVWSPKPLEIQQLKRLNMPAEIAVGLAEKYGLVAAMPHGEDSAGRAKLRLMTPHEIAERATETAKLLWLEFQKREWILDIPVPTENEDAA